MLMNVPEYISLWNLLLLFQQNLLGLMCCGTLFAIDDVIMCVLFNYQCLKVSKVGSDKCRTASGVALESTLVVDLVHGGEGEEWHRVLHGDINKSSCTLSKPP